MSEKQSSRRRCTRTAFVALTAFGLVAAPTMAHATTETPASVWQANVTSLESGVQSGYQLAAAGGSIYVADAQWRAERKLVGTPENTPLETGTSMRSTFSPYGIEVDADVNGETVIVTTTARQRSASPDYSYGGGVVVYSASQGAPTDADRVFEFEDGSPVFSGPRRIAIDTERNLAYVTSLGDSRGSSDRQGYITVLDLTKRGIEAVVAQVTVPDAAGSVGVDVDVENNLIYVGGYADSGEPGTDAETLYVIDGAAIDFSAPQDFALNNGAISALDAVVGPNARPTFNADTKKVYVSAYDESLITVVDADPASATYGVADTSFAVTTGSGAELTGTNALEVDAERGLLYSANLDAGVSVYDIENGYERIEFTGADGTVSGDIPTSGRAVNFGLNEATGEMWVSMWGSTGTVDIIDVTEQLAPVFGAQPVAAEVTAGETAVFSAEVAGAPAPALQWQTKSGAAAEWVDVVGATTNTLEVAAIRGLDGAQYRLVATNEYGQSVSAVADLTVRYAPVVTSSPISVAVPAGSDAQFTVTGAANPAASVAWQQQVPGTTEWVTIEGATEATLVVENVTVEQRGTQYRAVLANDLGEAASTSAALAVNAERPAPLTPSEWQQFVPADTAALLQLDNGGLEAEQTGSTLHITGVNVPDGDWVEAFGYSQPVYLGSHLVQNGSTTVSIAGFAPGTHNLALFNTQQQLVGYAEFVINADGTGAVTNTPAGAQVLSTTGAGDASALLLGGAASVLLLGAGAVGVAAARRRNAS